MWEWKPNALVVSAVESNMELDDNLAEAAGTPEDYEAGQTGQTLAMADWAFVEVASSAGPQMTEGFASAGSASEDSAFAGMGYHWMQLVDHSLVKADTVGGISSLRRAVSRCSRGACG